MADPHGQLGGVYQAVVVDTNDPEESGRLTVKVAATTGNHATDWISGIDSGEAPQPGDVGWVAYQSGDVRYPVWLGLATQSQQEVLPPLRSRSRTDYTTQLTQAGAHEISRVRLGLSFQILHISMSAPARVRLYSRVDAQEADLGRLITDNPVVGAGVILDVLTGDTLDLDIMPVIAGSNMEVHPTPEIPVTVTPIATGVVSVTFTFVRTE